MNDKPLNPAKARREDELARALRDNLRRRKAAAKQPAPPPEPPAERQACAPLGVL